MYSANPRKLPEKKELETKTKLSEDPKDRFLNELYQGQMSLYAKDVKEKDEKSTRQFTAQTWLLVTRINIEQNKESVFKKINAELKEKKLPDLTDEQKKLIYAKDLDSSDPIQSLFAKHMPNTNKWGKVINRFFDPYHSASLVPHNNNSEKIRIERIKLFDRGKYLLENFCYFISQPNINPLLREIALTDAEYAIDVCPEGFLEHMETAIESFDSDIEKLVKHKYISQAASNFRNKILAERGMEHFSSNTKILTPGNSIHAENELKNAIHLNDDKNYQKFSNFVNKSDDSDAKNYFAKTELEKFPGFCFDDKKALQHNLIEILYSHFDSLLHGIKDIESANYFIKQLNSIGALDEDRSAYVEEKEEKIVLKEEKEITRTLRISLQKRLMTGNFLNEHISRKKIPLEKKSSCSVIMSSIPFKEEDSKNFEAFIQSSQNTSHAYVLFDREFDLVGYRYETLPNANALEKFFLNGHIYAYGIFEKSTKTTEGKEIIEKELYYLQKNPAKITRIKHSALKIILKNIRAFNEIPTSIKSELEDKIETIKKLQPAEHFFEKRIYYVTKEPFTIELVSKNPEIFQKIIEENNDLKNTDETIKSIQKLTKYIEPALYINCLSPNLSYIKTDGKPLELFFDYFKTLSEQDQYNVLQNTIDFKDHSYLDFLVECIHFIKNPTILKNNLTEYDLTKLLTIAINGKDFSTADKILQVNPSLEKELLSPIKPYRFIPELIDIDDGENIKAAFQFHKKYNLSFHTELFIDAAAKKGKIKSLEALLTIAANENLTPLDILPNLREGLKLLIKKDDYVNINYILTIYFKDQDLKDLKELIRSKLLEYLDNNRRDHFKQALQYLPNSLTQDIFHDEKESPLLIEAAKRGNFTIVNLMLEKKINAEIKYQEKTYQGHYIEGLTYLLERNKVEEAFVLINEHLKLSEEEQKILAPNFVALKMQLIEKMIDYSKDLSDEGVKNLENALKIIQHLPNYQKEDLNTRDKFENPIVFYAAYCGNLKALKLLEEYGANLKEAPNEAGYDFYDNLKECIYKLAQNKNYDKIDDIIKCYPEIYKTSKNYPYPLWASFFNCDPILKSIAMHCPIEGNIKITVVRLSNQSVYTQEEIKQIAKYCQRRDITAMLTQLKRFNNENLINIIFLQILKQSFNQPKNKEHTELNACLQYIENETLENKSPNWENLLNQLSQYIPLIEGNALLKCAEKFSVLRDKFFHFLIKNNHFESATVFAPHFSIRNDIDLETIKELHDLLCDAIEKLNIPRISVINKLLLFLKHPQNIKNFKELTRSKLLQYLDNNRSDYFTNALEHFPNFIMQKILLDPEQSPVLIEAAKKGNFKIVNLILEEKINDKIVYQGKTYKGHYIEGLSYLIERNKTDEALELIVDHLKLSKEEQKTLAPNFILLKNQLIGKIIAYSEDLSDEGVKNLENALKITQHLPYYRKEDLKGEFNRPIIFHAAYYGNLKALKLLEEYGADFNAKDTRGDNVYDILKYCIKNLEEKKDYDKIADIIKCYPNVYKAFLKSDEKHILKRIVMLCPIKDNNIKILRLINNSTYTLAEIEHIANSCQEKNITDMLTIVDSFNDTNLTNIIFLQILKQYFHQSENKNHEKLNACLQNIEKETLENKSPNWENLLNQLSQHIPLMEKNAFLACVQKFSVLRGKFFEFLIKNKHIKSANAIIASYPLIKNEIKKETIKTLHNQLSDAIQKLDLSRISQITNLLLAISTNSTDDMFTQYVHGLQEELHTCIDTRNTEKFKILINILEILCPDTLSDKMNGNLEDAILSHAALTGYFEVIHFLMDEYKVSIESRHKAEFNLALIRGIKYFIKENKNESDYKSAKKILERFKNEPLDELSGQPLIHFCLDSPVSLDHLIKNLKINAKDHKGWTALHVVAKNNNHPLILKLVENDINIHTKDIKQNTAFDYADEQTKALIFILSLKKVIKNHFGNHILPLVSAQLEYINQSITDEKPNYLGVVKKLQEIANTKPISHSQELFPPPKNPALESYLNIFKTGFFSLNPISSMYSNIQKFEEAITSTVASTIKQSV